MTRPDRPIDRRTFLALGAGAAAATAFAACGGGGKKAESTTTTTTTTTTAPPPPPVSPLTGEIAANAAMATRPALVVKIDNADGGGGNSARPQSGLDIADVVFEEMVEGSVTRFAAIFQSADIDVVGPIRSGRDTDIEILSALNHPYLAWSGGAPDVANAIRSAPINDLSASVARDAYFRRNDLNPAPHNLYASTIELYKNIPPDPAPPPPLFTFRAPGEPFAPTSGAVACAQVHLEYGGGGGSAPVDYTWSPLSATWWRDQKGTPHLTESGTQINPRNVIVQLCEYFPNGGVDVVGTPVYQATLIGSGECWVLMSGAIIRGTWSKTAAEAVTTYVDAAGAPIKLDIGRTYVALVPVGGATVVA
jgi:hypothetical protein